MKTSAIGYPRIGAHRELKKASEQYFRRELDRDALERVARELRAEHWRAQKDAGVDFISSGDFSFYDGTLDLAATLNVVPARFRALSGASELDVYFAMARGAQSEQGDVKALAMKKWFNTNYHYVVPELADDAEIRLTDDRIFSAYEEAKALGLETKPTTLGPFTFLKLCRTVGTRSASSFAEAVASAFVEIVKRAGQLGVAWLQFDEPWLVRDMTSEDRALLVSLYEAILPAKGDVKILLQTYFGDVRDCVDELGKLDFDGLGLDFVEGRKTLELVLEKDFVKGKTLFAGVVNGKNVWRNDYAKSLEILRKIRGRAAEIVVGTSCSLLHVPYSLAAETQMPENVKVRLAFAEEKLVELRELAKLAELDDPTVDDAYKANVAALAVKTNADDDVRRRVANLSDADFTRLPARPERIAPQRAVLNLPLLPTTTIGSFPQTTETRAKRAAFRKGEITRQEYEAFLKETIKSCVRLQEELGLDVLVHGEYERNDMVEYFGENLKGFQFMREGWVQSYGTRCVKPPIIVGDVSREKPITVEWSKYAQSLTTKPVKGMLTGPTTILNWSFPREDVSLKEQALQIATAIQDEVLDLERNGIKIVQIDEAALREKLPLRRDEWYSQYLDWAIPAFRLVHSKVRPETQIHTHMCYSEFTDIIKAIDDMDADVISFEASRSDLQILDSLKENDFQTQVGPGVYDIHSPRVPSVEEIVATLEKELARIDKQKLWVNPDCGLKTRDVPETVASLTNLVAAAKRVREKIGA